MASLSFAAPLLEAVIQPSSSSRTPLGRIDGRRPEVKGFSARDRVEEPPLSSSFVTGVVALFAGIAVIRKLVGPRQRSSRERKPTAMWVRRRQLPMLKEKEVLATKRLPLWKLSDEMYLERQLAPDPDLTWTEIRKTQARMRVMVRNQQDKDMRKMEREVAGFRLEPRYNIGELRQGMWLDGRVSRSKDRGFMVDIGCYTDQGAWVDGFVHVSQIREDGAFIEVADMTKELYLGEIVRVRVDECLPSSGMIKLSMRSQEDLPELFMGERRPYCIYDLEEGMKLTGIVRRVWDNCCWVDVGADRLLRVHISGAPREKNVYGFYKKNRAFRWARQAFARGAELELWVTDTTRNELAPSLSCNKPRSAPLEIQADGNPRSSFASGEEVGPQPKRRTKAQIRDQEKSEAEMKSWEPYVPHVDEWLEDAGEPDDETDSWVMRAEKELFEDAKTRFEAEEGSPSDDENPWTGQTQDFDQDDFGEDDEFAEDEFAEDDFIDNSAFTATDQAPFAAKELDGWILEDDDAEKEEEDKNDPEVIKKRQGEYYWKKEYGQRTPEEEESLKLNEDEAEDLFHAPNDRGAGNFAPKYDDDFDDFGR
eukprot:TRINITY_DN8690_c0_g3_i1.p1 TRINITY_DN8690_c0_g3~~TRINITY_DN8690_c0_g3_i1.p1  ORF type:complete len:593 (+),score=130.68 TRINITY_DN8690_c0_g3_i1:51-1829(+)